MSDMNVNFGTNEVKNMDFKYPAKEKAWQEAMDLMQQIETVAYDAVQLDGSSSDFNKNSGDVMLLDKNRAAGGAYSAHVKYDPETKRITSAKIEMNNMMLSLSGEYPKKVYSERKFGERLEKRLELDFSTNTAEYKYLRKKGGIFPRKGYTIKAGSIDNYESLAQARAYEDRDGDMNKGIKMKERVESLGSRYAQMDNEPGVDKNPEAGFVDFGDPTTNQPSGQVKFNTETGENEKISVQADQILYQKTIHKDRTEFAITTQNEKETFKEYNGRKGWHRMQSQWRKETL
jgi:hypothetical protein